MTRFERLQSPLILAAVALGLFLGQFARVATYAASLITPFLMAMLFGVFLQIPVRHLGKAWKDLRFTGLSLGMNFLWTPLLAYALGYVYVRNVPDLWVGLIMLMVTPCTDWYLVFTNIARGNVLLATVQLPWKLVLQLLLLPLYLLLLAGAVVEINQRALFMGIVTVLLIPFLLASVTRRVLLRLHGEVWVEETLLGKAAMGQFVFLAVAIMAVFASQGAILLHNPTIVLKLLPPVVLFFAVNFIIGQGIGRMFRFSYEDTVGFHFTTLARNSPLALAIAIAAFPDRPLIALTLAIGPLIELPILALIAQLLLFLRKPGFQRGGMVRQQGTLQL